MTEVAVSRVCGNAQRKALLLDPNVAFAEADVAFIPDGTPGFDDVETYAFPAVYESGAHGKDAKIRSMTFYVVEVEREGQ